jgi:hypothetical protein
MKDSLIYTIIRKFLFFFVTTIAKALPRLEASESVDIFPPIFSLPVSLPVNYNTLPVDFAKHFIKVKSIPKRQIFVLKNVYVNGSAVIFKNLRIFRPSLTWYKDIRSAINGHLLFRQWHKSVIDTIPDTSTVALVYDDWSASNYYHWMIESLPRLLMIKEKFPESLVIVPEPTQLYILTTIEMLGFSNLYFLHREKRDITKVSRLLLPELVYYEENENDVINKDQKQNVALNRKSQTFKNNIDIPKEELIVSVRKKLLSFFPNNACHPSKKIFVSRSRQQTRRLLNESEILPILEKYGFEIFYFEDMTFEEQVNLMLDTTIFISIHGANMVNILFMQPGAKVIEMMNLDYVNDAYYLLSSSLNLSYYSLPCTLADSNIKLMEDTVKLNDADLLVSVTKLEEVIHFTLY